MALMRKVLRAHVKLVGSPKAFAFGVYKSLPKSYAVRGKGISLLTNLAESVLRAAPHGEVTFNEFKAIVKDRLVPGPGAVS